MDGRSFRQAIGSKARCGANLFENAAGDPIQSPVCLAYGAYSVCFVGCLPLSIGFATPSLAAAYSFVLALLTVLADWSSVIWTWLAVSRR